VAAAKQHKGIPKHRRPKMREKHPQKKWFDGKPMEAHFCSGAFHAFFDSR